MYEGALTEDPITNRKPCTATDQCEIVNCPFAFFTDMSMTCINLGSLRSANTNDPSPAYYYSIKTFKEYFLNFVFSAVQGVGPSSINGTMFDTPDFNHLTQPNETHSSHDRCFMTTYRN